MSKIRSQHRLIFNMEIVMLSKDDLYIETGLRDWRSLHPLIVIVCQAIATLGLECSPPLKSPSLWTKSFTTDLYFNVNAISYICLFIYIYIYIYKYMFFIFKQGPDDRTNGRHWQYLLSIFLSLTHCGRVTHICVSKLTIVGSDKDWEWLSESMLE